MSLKNSNKTGVLVPLERIEDKIYLIRGQKVMLDKDLAGLYGVPNKRLKEQVRRNVKRFPRDFMFELTWAEAESIGLRSQNGVGSINSVDKNYDNAIFSV